MTVELSSPPKPATVVQPAQATIASFADFLEATKGEVRIACDTEYQGPHTLSIQFATRIGDDIVVQVYRSPSIPQPPSDFDFTNYIPDGLRSRFNRVIVRPTKKIVRELSPVCALASLYGLEGIATMAKRNGDGLRKWGMLAPPLTIHLIPPFWTADFYRIFGERFYTSLIETNIGGGRIVVQAQKLLAFREVTRGINPYQDPVLEYVLNGDDKHAVKVRTFDTSLPYGKVSLETH